MTAASVSPNPEAGEPVEMTRLHRLGSPRVTRQIRDIATKQYGQAERIAARMVQAYVEEIPSYSQIEDPMLREDVQSVSAALVRAWLQVMSTGESVSTETLAPILQGARRRAAQGIDLHSMLRAYRVGIRVMWSELVAAPEWQSQALQAAVVHLAEWALDFADRVSTEVAAAYMDEIASVNRAREHQRSSLLDLILAGPGLAAGEQPAELDRRHAVVVARVEDDLDLNHLDAIGSILERETGATLWTVRRRSVIAVVAQDKSGSRRAMLRRLAGIEARGIQALGLGGDARDGRETRQSYTEATEALRIGPVHFDDGRRVYDYQELAPAAALLARPDAARRFVATALEPHGALLDKPWVLPTLQAFVARQGRLKETAAQLDVHVNTVKYRLRELREGTSIDLVDGERLQLVLLALKLRRLLEAD